MTDFDLNTKIYMYQMSNVINESIINESESDLSINNSNNNSKDNHTQYKN